ncbi:MAG: AbgT family transporter [Ignavibacteriales bacterium]|nr:AbgT family transporter [Ignavibacteriales bacterium]
MSKNNPAVGVWDKFLNIIEKGGNLLPHPATLFFIFAVVIVAVSGLASWTGIEVQHPAKDEMIKPVNLLSIDGLHYILTSLVVNFTSFAPLGTVLVALLGIGVAEGSGLMGTALRLIVLKAPKKILTFVIVFSGVMSNAASEVGYVLLIPLAAIIFLAVGRHPILGIAAAFAGVSGGYSANLLLGTIDPLLAGLSQEAAHIIDKTYMVNPAANYYFMAFSTFLIAGAGTWVTEKIVSPRLGAYTGDEKPEELKPLTDLERKGLIYAVAASLAIVVAILAGLIPENGFLRDPKTNDILKSPFMSGIVSIIFFGGALAGIAYGIGAKTIRSDSDVMKGMGKAMETLGSYMVLVFFAAQFGAELNKSNLGLIIAVEGSTLLKSLNLGEIPLMISFVILTSVLNLFMGSASAKWAIMAPVFIPMFMLLGYSPEFTQVAYRVGDSVSNVISPMMSYFALIIAMIQRYDKGAGLGTLISTMVPYTIVFFIVWSLVLVGWVSLDLPLGPGSRLYYP